MTRNIEISPSASDEEVAAITAALSRYFSDLLFGAEENLISRSEPPVPEPTWRFSGRWWQ